MQSWVFLMKVTQQALFFSGDTAQTIAKRVVFRFCDINHATPVVKERSNLDGPKPMLLADEDIELLFLVYFGEEEFKNQRSGLQFFLKTADCVRLQSSYFG